MKRKNTDSVRVRIKIVDENAVIPKYAHEGDAAFDVSAVHDLTLQPKERGLVKTGLAFEIPKGYEIQIRPRSGLALKQGIGIVNSPGTIDSGYRGEVGIIIINHSSKPFFVKKGDRVAQFVLNKVETAKFDIVEELDKTERGVSGYGSTGLKNK